MNYNLNERLKTDDISDILNKKPLTREDYIQKFEAAYNFGPPSFPPQVFIELTSICNLKCTFCGYSNMQRENKLMDRELAKKIIDECAENGVWYLTFQFYGEPTTIPDYFTEMIKYAKSKGIINVNTTSNMTLMKPKIIKDWIDAGLDTLNISFDAAVPELYEKNRGHSYDKVLKNIIETAEIIKDYGNGIPFTSITLVVTDETYEEIEEFKKKMSPYVNTFDIRRMLAFDFKTKKKDLYLEQNQNKTKRIPCREVGPRLIVTSSGETTVCCSDVDAKLSIGNVNEKSIKEIWNSDEMAKIYMLHRQQRWSELPEICKTCKDYDWIGGMPEPETKDKRWLK